MNIDLKKIRTFCETNFPETLAEDWDNVGLLIGNSDKKVRKIMTCLTLSTSTLKEAILTHVDLIISHHPLPFKSLNKITSETIEGRLLLDLIKKDIAVLCYHTAYDSAKLGINQQIADSLGLERIIPLRPSSLDSEVGGGRLGHLIYGRTLKEVLEEIKFKFGVSHLQYCGNLEAMIRSIAIGCGAGGTFLSDAIAHKCHLFITGETNFHNCQLVNDLGMNMVLLGHYVSEQFAMENLARELKKEFPHLEIWASHNEQNPINYF